MIFNKWVVNSRNVSWLGHASIPPAILETFFILIKCVFSVRRITPRKNDIQIPFGTGVAYLYHNGVQGYYCKCVREDMKPNLNMYVRKICECVQESLNDRNL